MMTVNCCQLSGKMQTEKTGFALQHLEDQKRKTSDVTAGVATCPLEVFIPGVNSVKLVLMEFVNLISGLVQTVVSVVSATVEAAPTHRQCNIEIANECLKYTLCNPRMYTSSGRCTDPLPPKILPSSSGVTLFTKTPYAARGSVGIFTYDLLNDSEKAATEQMAVLFKVPFDLNRKSNVYAVGVFDASKECARDLFREMSKNVDSTFVRGKAKGPGLIHKSQNFTIMATMSDCYQPIMKVQVSDN